MTNNLRKLELKERIQAAAKRVFLAKGFSEAKISDIASEAGVSPSTIYLYFSGKRTSSPPWTSSTWPISGRNLSASGRISAASP